MCGEAGVVEIVDQTPWRLPGSGHNGARSTNEEVIMIEHVLPVTLCLSSSKRDLACLHLKLLTVGCFEACTWEAIAILKNACFKLISGDRGSF